MQYKPLIRFIWLGALDHGTGRTHRCQRTGATACDGDRHSEKETEIQRRSRA